MDLEEKAEELLETLWIRAEERKETSIPLDDPEVGESKAVEQLLAADYIFVSDERVALTDRGRPEAINVVRRHRLAERLLADVLGAGDRLLHEKACKFEHLLDRGLDENICSLLGHPRVCPHGKPIPAGRCCQEQRAQPQKVVTPLSQLSKGQKGRVAYIHAPESSKLQKLMALGILPGTSINLIQRFPSYVFQTGQTQFAVDKEIADAIYIRLVEEEMPDQKVEEQQRGRKWRRSRQRHRLSLW